MKPTAAGSTTFKQTGLTLVEIMIALLLGLFLIAGVISIFVSNKQTYRLNESLSRLQEDGRFVMEIFGSRLRSASYAGCYGDISAGVQNVLNNQANFAWNLTTPVQGFDNVAASAAIQGIATRSNTGAATSLTSGVATASIAGTDVLVLKGMSAGVPLATNPNNTTFTIAAANNRFTNGEILLVTNCDQASLFQASSVTTAGAVTTILHASGGGLTPGNNSSSISETYGVDAEIGRLQTLMYNIRQGANGRAALFESRLVVTGGNTVALTASELIPNVENMQLVFGVDTSGDQDADVYQDASAVVNWQNVVSVRIALLLASEEDNQVSVPESYTFNAATFTYDKDNPIVAARASRRFRRVFTGFVALRNRIL